MNSGSGLCQASTRSKRSSSVDRREDGVVADRVPELAQPCDRALARGRGEVVEDAPRHQEVRRARAGRRLELGQLERGLEREIDVVAQEEVAGPGLVVEEREAVAARLAPRPAARGSARRSNGQLTRRPRPAAWRPPRRARAPRRSSRRPRSRSRGGRRRAAPAGSSRPRVRKTSAWTTPGKASTRSSPLHSTHAARSAAVRARR